MIYKYSTLFSVLLLFLIISCKPKKDKPTVKLDERPNILFIMSDDHAYQAISAYDSKLIQTPNIDRLAKEGIMFSNASVTNSICAPSRAVILTGKHAHINGKIDNVMPFDSTQTTFPQLFQKKGYQTAMFGKLHFGNSPKGVDRFMIVPGQGQYFNPDFINEKGDTIVIDGYATDIITDLTLNWLKTERNPEKPFMMMYLQKAPHRPWWPRADKFNEFAKKTFPLPKNLFDDYSNRGSAAAVAEMNLLKHMYYSYDTKVKPSTISNMPNLTPKIEKLDMAWESTFSQRLSEEQRAPYDQTLDSIAHDFKKNWPKMTDREKMVWKYQRYMQDYLACISSVDDNVGRVLDYLDESDLTENTMVIYTSDQGFYLGEHGWFDKRFIYEESFKTPLLIRWPNKIAPGTTEDEMVQNLDFAQTFLEAAMIKVPDDMQGESLMPLLTNTGDNWNREAVYYHYYEYPGEHNVKRHYGIINKEFKLVHFYFDTDEWELYDRKNDPTEMRNVYNDAAYAEVIKKLHAELEDLRVLYGDSKKLDAYYIDLYKQKDLIK